MCGIAGVSLRDQVSEDTLAAAGRALAHRGPDSHGVYVSPAGTEGLVHTRLAIIDLSPSGHQPMVDANSGVAITFNGEIYNFRELKSELTGLGFQFRGGSDTEVLLAGYLAWGERVVEHLSGIFAFAIHDPRTGSLFLVRDHLGIKPLYYAQTRHGFAFASELKAIPHLMPVDLSLDRAAVARYLTFLWSPGPQTPFAAIRKVAPAEALIVENGAIKRSWIYWTPPAYRPRTDWTSAECAARLADIVSRCVRRQLVSDAPLGAFLSGGLDSSAVVAAARRANRDLDCFTISLEGGAENGSTDDLPYARRVARHLGVVLHEVNVTAQAMCDNIGRMVATLDEPLADPACLNIYFISTLAREHGMKVLLSGAGGDDLFTGYRRHQALAFATWMDAVPAAVWRQAAKLPAGVSLGRRIVRFAEMAALRGDDRIVSSFLWTQPAQALDLLSRDARADLDVETIVAPLHATLADHRGEPAVERCLALEQRYFLADHNLTYTDKMAMAAGVEVRVPLIDLEMVEFAASVPVGWKLHGTTAKWIFKQSQRGSLPDDVIDRPKTGFGAPLRRWIGEGLKDLVGDLLSRDAIVRRGLFDPDAVARLMTDNASGRVDGAYTLFSLMCQEMWCREFVDRAAGVRPQRAGVSVH